MRSKNKLVMAFLIAFAAIQAKADGNNEVWHIETDTKLSIPLQDIGFIVAADDDVSFSIVTVTNEKFDGVTMATFSKHEASGIWNTASEDFKVTPTVVTFSLCVFGCRPGAEIRIVSAGGATCLTAKAEGGNATINVSRLAPGHYVLTVDGRSVRIIKR